MDEMNIFEGDQLISLFDSSNDNLTDDKIIELIKAVLIGRFADSRKQEVKQFSNRFNFACPFCGDSQKQASKHRGNVFFDNDNVLRFKCFNCGTSHLFKTFISKLAPELSKTTYIPTFNTEKKQQKESYFDLDLIRKYAIKKDVLKEQLGWEEIKGSKGEYYIRFRRHMLNADKFLYNKKTNSIVILNIDNDDNVIGAQSRFIQEPKYGTKFLSFKLSKLYSLIGQELSQSDLKSVKQIDQISNTFNILQVDFNDRITVFEGPFDAFLYKNSIAIAGASKELPFQSESVRYWYDDDETGKKKSLEHISKGDTVFLWDKYWELYGERLTVKDLNKLVIVAKKYNYQLPDFELCFSQNELDSIFI